MKVGESRDFRIAGRDYRDTLIAPDVHQISNPATGTAFGNVVQIPAEGRNKGYWLAGPSRERMATWTEAVQSVRAQHYEQPAVETVAVEVAPPAAPPVPPTPSKPTPIIYDNAPAGWLPAAEAARAHNLPSAQHVYNAHQAGQIAGQRVKCPRTRNGREWQWMFAPPPTPEPSPLDTTGWLPMDEALQAYGVSRGTMRRRIDAGKITTAREPYPNNHGYRLLIPPPITPAPARVVAAEPPAASEPKITIRPAGTKIRELEDQLAAMQTRLDAVEAASKRRSWLARLFG